MDIGNYQRNVLIHTTGEPIFSYSKMKELEEVFDRRFYRVYASYILNSKFNKGVKILT